MLTIAASLVYAHLLQHSIAYASCFPVTMHLNLSFSQQQPSLKAYQTFRTNICGRDHVFLNTRNYRVLWLHKCSSLHRLIGVVSSRRHILMHLFNHTYTCFLHSMPSTPRGSAQVVQIHCHPRRLRSIVLGHAVPRGRFVRRCRE